MTDESRRSLIANAVSDLGRLGAIGGVLARHGFGGLAGRLGIFKSKSKVQDQLDDPSDAAKRLRAVFEDLGPTFVKLGQVLSTRPDILPEEYITELARLQDQSQPLNFEEIEAQLNAALPEPYESYFEHFDKAPLATGSIAQTHLAVLRDGRSVVVKVQRPRITKVIEADLDLLHLLAKVLEATVVEMELYSPTKIVSEFDRGLRTELDFEIEAGHVKLFRSLFANNPRVYVPEVIGELSSRKVLVMEEVKGCKISEIEARTPRAHEAALTLLDMAYSMLFEHGVFHADPHPGNVFLTEDDRIGLIDFGLIGRVSQQQQDLLISLIISTASGDVDGVARVVLQLGRPRQRVPMRELRDDIVAIRSQFLLNTLGDVSIAEFVMALLEAGQRHRIRIPASYAILTKAAISLEGIVRRLDPELDIPATLSPYSRDLLLSRYGPQRLSQSMLNTALSASALTRELPLQMTQLLMDLEYDGLPVHLNDGGFSEMRRCLRGVGTKVSLAIISAGFAIAFGIFATNTVKLPLVGLLLGLGAAGSLALLTLFTLFEGRALRLKMGPILRLFGRR